MAVPTPEDPFPLREVPQRPPNAPPIDSIGVRSNYFLNIESIQVKRIVGAEVAYIYGNVEVDGTFAVEFAFNRESTQPQMTRVGDFLTLTGPNAEVLGHGITSITVDLYDAKHDDDRRREKMSFASGELFFVLGKTNFSIDDVNRRLSYHFSGKWGTVTLNYGMLDCSISARIKIVIIGDDGREEEDLEVFGTISLDQVVSVTGTTFQLKLFDHPTMADRVKVTAGGILPLERHIVPTPTAVRQNAFEGGIINNPKLAAAPVDYWNSDLPQLVFHVDLWAYFDDEVIPIASGISQFNVKPLDRVRIPKEEIIFGNFGRNVFVSVTCFG